MVFLLEGTMKKILFTIFIILLFADLNAQPPNVSTEVLAPFPTSSDVSVLRHISGESYIAALSESGIFRTDDAGRNWYKIQSTPSFNAVCDLKIFSPQRWYGITKQGEFFFTTDGGVRFFTQKILYPVDYMTPYMSFSDSLNGIICFQRNNSTSEIEYFVTANAGFTWERKTLASGISKGAVEIFSWKIWIFNDGNKVRRTTNGGIWWHDTFTKKSSDFFRLNDSTVIMPVKNDSVYISSDRGLTWTAIDTCKFDINPKDMVMLQNGNIYALNRATSTIYRSTDTCKTFTKIKTLYLDGPVRYFLSFVMISDSSGIITGEKGTICLLSGANLNLVPISKNHLRPSVAYFRDSKTGITTGGARTTDGGKNWIQAQYGVGFFEDNHHIALTKSGFGVMTFDYYTLTGYRSYIHATKDSGKSWQKIYSDSSHKYIGALEISDSLIAVIMVKYYTTGTLQKTKLIRFSGGVITSTDQELDLKLSEVVAISNPGIIYGITDQAVYRSKDTARTWVKLFEEANVSGFSDLMANSDGRVAFSVYTYNSLLSSADYGETWGRNYPVFSSGFFRMSLGQGGIVAGTTPNQIWYARPGASTWIAVPYKFLGAIANIQFVSGTELFAQSSITDMWTNSNSGFYYKITFNDSTTSIQELDPAVPGEFVLEQNYPNPFNPSTTIRFSLPAGEKTNLRVYNLLGQEVAELINADLPAGNHVVEFDAKSLSSGVYFYRLSTSGFSTTKKMILIR